MALCRSLSLTAILFGSFMRLRFISERSASIVRSIGPFDERGGF